MAQICGVHQVEMSYKEGKFGPWWACPHKDGQNKFDCKWKPPKATGPVQKFNQDLEKSGSQMDANKKEILITKTALAKSAIENGRHYNFETLAELERWFAWVNGRATPITPPQQSPDDEIQVEDIPF